MVHVESSECGMCVHFGQQHPSEPALVNIRSSHEAPETYVDECGHPKMELLHLLVTAKSHCDGFEPVSG